MQQRTLYVGRFLGAVATGGYSVEGAPPSREAVAVPTTAVPTHPMIFRFPARSDLAGHGSVS